MPSPTPSRPAPAAPAELHKLIPDQRRDAPAEFGRAAAWRTADESDYRNGVSRFSDGGMTLHPGFATGG